MYISIRVCVSFCISHYDNLILTRLQSIGADSSRRIEQTNRQISKRQTREPTSLAFARDSQRATEQDFRFLFREKVLY